MNTVNLNSIKLVADNTELGKNFPKEVIPYLLRAAESADAKLKNEIENKIVNIGKIAVPVLIKELENAKGIIRAIITMSLIRIGEESVKPLKDFFNGNSEFDWVVNYIVNEIKGSQMPLGNLQQVLVG